MGGRGNKQSVLQEATSDSMLHMRCRLPVEIKAVPEGLPDAKFTFEFEPYIPSKFMLPHSSWTSPLLSLGGMNLT